MEKGIGEIPTWQLRNFPKQKEDLNHANKQEKNRFETIPADL